MATVIQRTNTNPWGQAFGIIGQGLNGFTKGSMTAKQLDLQNKMNDTLTQLWGANGAGIRTPNAGGTQAPIADATAQPTSMIPSTPANAGGSSTSPISDDDWKQLLAQAVYKQPGIFGA